MHKRACLVTGLALGVLLSGTPLATSLIPSSTITVYASDLAYNSASSLIIIKPKASGKTVFSYKINGEYPKYSRDTVKFYNADGTLKETKSSMNGVSIFSDDYSDWIDVTKKVPKLGHETQYYSDLCQQDAECILPYSETNETNEFYIPVSEAGSKITVTVVNIADDGTASEVSSQEFTYDGVSITDVKTNATIKSVNKTSSSETVRISGDNILYAQVGSEKHTAKDNSVDIKLTSNGNKTFLVYGQDSIAPDVLTYTVEGLSAVVDKEISDEVVDSTAPIITSDAMPSTQQDTAIKYKVYTDEKATISINGVSAEGTELEVVIAGNGDYLVTATDEAGNYSEKTITFDCFTDIVGEYTLDRDNLWDEDQSPDQMLPKTGGIALATVLCLGGCITGAGVYMFKKGKKKEEEQ